MMTDIRDLKEAINNIPHQAIGLKEVAIKRQYAQKKNGMLADIFPITTSAELADFNQRLSDNKFNGSVVSDKCKMANKQYRLVSVYSYIFTFSGRFINGNRRHTKKKTNRRTYCPMF